MKKEHIPNQALASRLDMLVDQLGLRWIAVETEQGLVSFCSRSAKVTNEMRHAGNILTAESNRASK